METMEKRSVINKVAGKAKELVLLASTPAGELVAVYGGRLINSDNIAASTINGFCTLVVGIPSQGLKELGTVTGSTSLTQAGQAGVNTAIGFSR